jgi:hypothetical protein
VYVDRGAVRLYLAGKASGWHVGVSLLRQQSVVHAEVCRCVFRNSKFKLIIDVTQKLIIDVTQKLRAG